MLEAIRKGLRELVVAEVGPHTAAAQFLATICTAVESGCQYVEHTKTDEEEVLTFFKSEEDRAAGNSRLTVKIPCEEIGG